MRADPDRQDDLEEVSGSRPSFDDRPRARPSSPARPPSPPTNTTPLLTATLNAPLQSYYSGGCVRVKCPTDLQVTLSKKSKSEETEQAGSTSQTVFYSTLLKQLRQKAGDTLPSSQQVPPHSQKAKKEKGKSLLPFQCPACKKRFQRHIAMNAHIQNEHISPACSNGERSCRLCGAVSGSLSGVRLHLLSTHGIDLDNPAMCLVEEKRFSVLEASLRSGREDEDLPSCSNLDMSGSSASCSPAHTPSSSESPERSVYSTSQHSKMEEEDMQVEDLSLRRPCPLSPQLLARVPMGRFSPVPGSPRPESPCTKQSVKRPRLRESSPSPTFSSSSTISSPSPSLCRYTCTHCNIVYPNQTLYFLHKGFHSDTNPWRCNSCGHQSADLYDFNTHLFSVAHQ